MWGSVIQAILRAMKLGGIFRLFSEAEKDRDQLSRFTGGIASSCKFFGGDFSGHGRGVFFCLGVSAKAGGVLGFAARVE